MGAKNRDRKNVLDARQNLYGHGATDVDDWRVDLRGAKDRDCKGRLEVMGNLQGHRGYYANKHSADNDRDTQGQAIRDRMEEMGHLSFDCARTDIQSAGDCSRPINSTSTIKVRVRVGGVLLHLPHHPPHPPSDEVTELRSGGDCACTINSTSTIMVRVRVGGVLLDPPPHHPVFSPAILQHKRKITGFSSVKPPLSSSHNIIYVRVRVNGVLVFPDSHGERCSVPLSECDLYHQRTHLCVSSGASCRTRVGQNVSHHSPPILVSPKVHPWVKVFKGKSSTSVRTQCASIAHMKSVSYKAFHVANSVQETRLQSSDVYFKNTLSPPTNSSFLTKISTTTSIVTHFCFPTLGVAVPLRPGDFLMFNARITHCISSRCKQRDHVIALTMYLKTAVVGMNNNDLDLTTAQTSLLSTTNHSHHLRQL
jgi:hypothetical protein